jgi:hypothetical protein
MTSHRTGLLDYTAAKTSKLFKGFSPEIWETMRCFLVKMMCINFIAVFTAKHEMPSSHLSTYCICWPCFPQSNDWTHTAMLSLHTAYWRTSCLSMGRECLAEWGLQCRYDCYVYSSLLFTNGP